MAEKSVERYEALRAHALGQAAVDFVPLGLGVLRHRGLAAWLDTESAAVALPTRTPVVEGREGGRAFGFSGVKLELVRLVSGTVLLTAKGARDV